MCRANARQLPQPDFKTPKDFAGSETAQNLDVLFRDPAEAEFVGDAVHVAQEPWKAVGKRAVEVENDKRVGHYLKGTRGAKWRSIAPMSRNMRGGIRCAIPPCELRHQLRFVSLWRQSSIGLTTSFELPCKLIFVFVILNAGVSPWWGFVPEQWNPASSYR